MVNVFKVISSIKIIFILFVYIFICSLWVFVFLFVCLAFSFLVDFYGAPALHR